MPLLHSRGESAPSSELAGHLLEFARHYPGERLSPPGFPDAAETAEAAAAPEVAVRAAAAAEAAH